MTMDIITRKAAKAAGLTRFFTGKPCLHGHVVERYMSGLCCACQRESQRKFREAHPERAREATRKWSKANPVADRPNREARLAANRKRSRKWYAENREAKLADNRKWYAENREDRIASTRKYTKDNWQRDEETRRKACQRWREANPEYASNHYIDNKAMYHVATALRRVVILNAIPLRAFKGKSESTRQANYDRLQVRLQNGSKAVADLLCPDYKERMLMLEVERVHLQEFLGVDVELHLDHKISLDAGGEHHPDNLWPLLKRLNLEKGPKSLGIDWFPPENVFEQTITRNK